MFIISNFAIPQEVDHFKFLQKALGTMGYEGVFFPKPSSPCLSVRGNNGPDGCAMFFRTERFELIQSKTKIIDIWRMQSNQVRWAGATPLMPLLIRGAKWSLHRMDWSV